jgi:hypothetical protein
MISTAFPNRTGLKFFYPSMKFLHVNILKVTIKKMRCETQSYMNSQGSLNCNPRLKQAPCSGRVTMGIKGAIAPLILFFFKILFILEF